MCCCFSSLTVPHPRETRVHRNYHRPTPRTTALEEWSDWSKSSSRGNRATKEGGERASREQSEKKTTNFLSFSHLSVQMLPLEPSRTSEPPEALVISSALKMTPPSSFSQEEEEEEVTIACLFFRTVDDAAEERCRSFDDADEEEEAASEAAFLIARCWKGVAQGYVCRETLLQWCAYYSYSLSRCRDTCVCVTCMRCGVSLCCSFFFCRRCYM